MRQCDPTRVRHGVIGWDVAVSHIHDLHGTGLYPSPVVTISDGCINKLRVTGDPNAVAGSAQKYARGCVFRIRTYDRDRKSSIVVDRDVLVVGSRIHELRGTAGHNIECAGRSSFEPRQLILINVD